MKNLSLLILTFTLMFLVNSCVTPDAQMKRYLGRQINEVILINGPANDIQPDGEGGKVYTWIYARNSYYAYRTFICDKYGTIYAYRWQGL